jgi:hypothetical protein
VRGCACGGACAAGGGTLAGALAAGGAGAGSGCLDGPPRCTCSRPAGPCVMGGVSGRAVAASWRFGRRSTEAARFVAAIRWAVDRRGRHRRREILRFRSRGGGASRCSTVQQSEGHCGRALRAVARRVRRRGGGPFTSGRPVCGPCFPALAAGWRGWAGGGPFDSARPVGGPSAPIVVGGGPPRRISSASVLQRRGWVAWSAGGAAVGAPLCWLMAHAVIGLGSGGCDRHVRFCCRSPPPIL